MKAENEDMGVWEMRAFMTAILILFVGILLMLSCVNTYKPCRGTICSFFCEGLNISDSCGTAQITINQCDERTCYWRTVANYTEALP